MGNERPRPSFETRARARSSRDNGEAVTRGWGGVCAAIQNGGHGAKSAPLPTYSFHSNFMSRHFVTSPALNPELMMMQPRTLRAVLSLAHTA